VDFSRLAARWKRTVVAWALHTGDSMNWIEVVLLLAGWALLQYVVLPRLGVPT
jgi:hypothetical protein